MYRRPTAIVAFIILSVGLVPGVAHAAQPLAVAKVGGICTKVGAVKVISRLGYVCTKNRKTKKLTWVKKTLVKKVAAKKIATPTTSPTPSPTPTPTTITFVPTSTPSPTTSSTTQLPEVTAFILGMPFDLNQVAKISKFRSCSGHDYSSMNTDGIQETNRSMKHYVSPLATLIGTSNQVAVRAPMDGTVTTMGTSSSYGGVGTDIWINPDSSPSWVLIFFHITSTMKIGDSVKTGQVIGYANLSNTTVNAFDIALERFTNPDGTPQTLEQAHQKYGDYSQLLHRGELDSIFNHMTPDILANFANKGFTPQKEIISQSDRDATPCTFGGSDNPADWVAATS